MLDSTVTFYFPVRATQHYHQFTLNIPMHLKIDNLQGLCTIQIFTVSEFIFSTVMQGHSQQCGSGPVNMA